jgi:hypothetical protein
LNGVRPEALKKTIEHGRTAQMGNCKKKVLSSGAMKNGQQPRLTERTAATEQL